MAKEKGGKKALAPKIEQEAAALALPLLKEAGCDLWDVCFEKEGAMWYLRVLFDCKDGVDSDRCEEISKPINLLFDDQKFIEQVDILEIGTPGLYKKLRKPEHFRTEAGERIRAQVKTEKGETFIIGILQDYSEENGTITVDGQQIKLSKCIKVNLEPLDDEAAEEIDEIRYDSGGLEDLDENTEDPKEEATENKE
ncbi:MAG: ribosome assembly cofactor RimP [Firmicutes bacterium]|nr:ribosome assembly cofactor RimP [[Eubacterium] siraeum]MCM1488220.1 ribosome assembly cofactor RimP [Bacillota bacterium]